jgi:DedD protein
MPPDLPNEQELSLKKRARRRLVGAIVLVLLMLVVLPRILQDRVALVPQEAIKITMTESADHQQLNAASVAGTPVQTPTLPQVDPNLDSATKTPVPETPTPAGVAEKSDNLKSANNNADSKNTLALESIAKDAKTTDQKVTEPKATLANGLRLPDVSEPKVSDLKLVDSKPSVAKVVDSKIDDVKTTQKKDGNFSIQVGVYSEVANVKQLQAKLKQTGFSSHTQKITTPKGEKIRLRAGSFVTRQEANAAIPKLQKIGLSGMVVSNE